MKRLTSIVLVLLVAAAAIGFAEGKTEEPTGPVKLLFWTHEDKNRETLEGQFIKEFQEQNPTVTVERVLYPSTKIQEATLAAFAANQGPDIFNMAIEDEYQYIANSRVAPVIPEAAGYTTTQQIVNAYIPNVLDPVTVKGKIYGLPLELTNWCIYLNKKIFREAGLDPEKDYPKTWEDMMAVSEKTHPEERRHHHPSRLRLPLPLLPRRDGARWSSSSAASSSATTARPSSSATRPGPGSWIS